MTDRWYHQALHRLLRTGSVTFGDRPGVPIVAFDAMKRELREIARVAVQEERRQVRAILDDIDAGWHRAECEGRNVEEASIRQRALVGALDAIDGRNRARSLARLKQENWT